MMPKKVICIVGPIAAGKGTVVKILEEKGYIPYSFSDRIKEELKKRGMEISRFTLNQISNEMRTSTGDDVWARRNAEAIDQDPHGKIVVDGARNPQEIKFLQEKYGAKVLGVTADQETRYERLKARGLVNENLSFEQFKDLDNRELNQTDEHAQQVNACLKLADNTIDNNGTIEELTTKINQLF